MSGINKVILVARLGKDPEIKYTQGGDVVASFPVATSETWKDKNGEKREKTEWHNIVAWRRLAEICGEYLHKGSLIYVEGKLQTDSWEKDGEKRYSTKVVIREMQMLDSGGKGQSSESAPVQEPEDDVPF